jgi:hypothetical protein
VIETAILDGRHETPGLRSWIEYLNFVYWVMGVVRAAFARPVHHAYGSIWQENGVSHKPRRPHTTAPWHSPSASLLVVRVELEHLDSIGSHRVMRFSTRAADDENSGLGGFLAT